MIRLRKRRGAFYEAASGGDRCRIASLESLSCWQWLSGCSPRQARRAHVLLESESPRDHRCGRDAEKPDRHRTELGSTGFGWWSADHQLYGDRRELIRHLSTGSSTPTRLVRRPPRRASSGGMEPSGTAMTAFPETVARSESTRTPYASDRCHELGRKRQGGEGGSRTSVHPELLLRRSLRLPLERVRHHQLSGLDLHDAWLMNVPSFAGVNLSGTNLYHAYLPSSLTGADVNGANLDAVAGRVSVPTGGLTGTPAVLPHHNSLVDGYLVGPGADLSGASLSGRESVRHGSGPGPTVWGRSVGGRSFR